VTVLAMVAKLKSEVKAGLSSTIRSLIPLVTTLAGAN
jgi:hypothetical protein